jgi:pyridoxine 5-phosphate synthase
MAVVLGVNLDHIATIRQARGTVYPRPAEGAVICEECGVHGITLHLREDRRHIQNHDVLEVQKIIKTCTLNLEMAVSDEIIAFAQKVQPFMTTIVPERREELTTEGGLDVGKNSVKLKKLVKDFSSQNILVSLFIEPDRDIINQSRDTGAEFIEIHTGAYADATDASAQKKELDRLLDASEYAVSLGLRVNAGHGLTCENITPVLAMKGLEEVNIGHSIISRAVLIGLKNAIIEMKSLLDRG